MTDPNPETRSLALVGRFLKQVCDLEEKLNEAIAAALNIDDTKRFILCANIHFREKILILRSFLLNSDLSKSDKDRFDPELVKMGNLYDKRNTLAHQYFKTADDGDGIVFSIVHVKGGPAPQNTPWNEQYFNERAAELAASAATATQLREALTKGKFALDAEYLFWLMTGRTYTDRPTPYKLPPGLYNFQSQPPRPLRGSDPDPANPQTSEKTPDKPQDLE